MPQEGHGFLQRVSLYVIYTEVAYEILETSLRRECTFVFVCLVYKFFAVYEIRFLHFWGGKAKTTKKKIKKISTHSNSGHCHRCTQTSPTEINDHVHVPENFPAYHQRLFLTAPTSSPKCSSLAPTTCVPSFLLLCCLLQAIPHWGPKDRKNPMPTFLYTLSSPRVIPSKSMTKFIALHQMIPKFISCHLKMNVSNIRLLIFPSPGPKHRHLPTLHLSERLAICQPAQLSRSGVLLKLT